MAAAASPRAMLRMMFIAASRRLPLGTIARVKNLRNEQQSDDDEVDGVELAPGRERREGEHAGAGDDETVGHAQQVEDHGLADPGLGPDLRPSRRSEECMGGH